MSLRGRARLALCGLTSVVVFAALGPAIASADDPSTCPDGWGCVWGQNFYTGNRFLVGSNTGGDYTVFNYHLDSAKNRFGSRKLKLYKNFDGVERDLLSCLDPQDSRPDPGWFNEVYVSDVTTDRCPN